MRSVNLFIAMSLDGYIADKNGDVSWLGGEAQEENDMVSYEKFIKDMDTVIMGAKTYRQLVEDILPNEWYYSDLTTYVITHHPEISSENIKFTKEDPINLIARLRKEPGKGIWICGGASVINQLIKADFIDKYIINVIPTLLGGGIPLFSSMEMEKKLKLIGTKTYNGIVDLVYERRMPGGSIAGR